MGVGESRVTIHMAASLAGFIARKDGSVDWLNTSDEFAEGDAMDPELVKAVFDSIDCYVMGPRTYETALRFEAQGSGWSYGDKPTFVLTSRDLPKVRDTVEFYSGDLAQFVNEYLGQGTKASGSLAAVQYLRNAFASGLPMRLSMPSYLFSSATLHCIWPRSKRSIPAWSSFATKCRSHSPLLVNRQSFGSLRVNSKGCRMGDAG